MLPHLVKPLLLQANMHGALTIASGGMLVWQFLRVLIVAMSGRVLMTIHPYTLVREGERGEITGNQEVCHVTITWWLDHAYLSVC